MKKLILLLTLGLITTADAQTTNAPKTYFEAFDATADAVIVKGMSSIGVLSSQTTYPIEVRAEELTNLQTSNKVYAVSIRTRISHQLLVDYIDYDELDGLIRGIQSISQANHFITQLDNFDAAFRTRSGLSIVKISSGNNSSGNKITIGIRPGADGLQRNVVEPVVLDDLGRLISAAKAKIDVIAQSNQ